MNLVVLGATGTTGQLVIDEALARGHAVTAVVRRPGVLAARVGLTVLRGAVDDAASLQACFAGADAVVSCLGARPGVRVLLRGTDFQRRTLPAIVAAINAAGVRRFVLMSSFGAGQTRAQAALFIRLALYAGLAKKLFDDKAIAEQALAQCQANWTAVYPVTLVRRPAIAGAELVPLAAVRTVPGIPRLPFATVAQVLVDLLADNNQAGQKLLLTTPGGWRP